MTREIRADIRDSADVYAKGRYVLVSGTEIRNRVSK
jgi:hypothetical protein